jgi:hypothetical protein
MEAAHLGAEALKLQEELNIDEEGKNKWSQHLQIKKTDAVIRFSLLTLLVYHSKTLFLE